MPLASRRTRVRRPAIAAEHGQAAVELVALLPVLAVVAALLWQAVVAGHAVWAAAGAAAAAARAAALGADAVAATAAARRALPPSLRAAVRVSVRADGTAAVALRVPAVLGDVRLPSVRARARFVPQS